MAGKTVTDTHLRCEKYYPTVSEKKLLNGLSGVTGLSKSAIIRQAFKEYAKSLPEPVVLSAKNFKKS